MSDVQEALRFLESECYGEVQCPPRTEAANTIREAIATLAAERDGLQEDARHMYESYGAAQARAEAAEARLAAAERERDYLRLRMDQAIKATTDPAAVYAMLTDDDTRRTSLENVTDVLAAQKRHVDAVFRAAIDAIAKEAS